MTVTAWKQGFTSSVDSLYNYLIYEAFKNKASVVGGLIKNKKQDE